MRSLTHATFRAAYTSAPLEVVTISNLAEVQKSYSLTDKTHGTVTFGPKETLFSIGNVADGMLKAEGDAVKKLTDPHITIWGKNARKDSWISSVEFSWAGARHVYFSLKRQTFSKPHTPSSDQAIAQTLETLLAQFLNLSQIASLTLTQSASSPSYPQANRTATPPSVSTSSATYTSDWPSLGDRRKPRSRAVPWLASADGAGKTCLGRIRWRGDIKVPLLGDQICTAPAKR